MDTLTHSNTSSDTTPIINSDSTTPEEDALRRQLQVLPIDNNTNTLESSNQSDDHSSRDHWFSPRPCLAIILLFAMAHRTTTHMTSSQIGRSIDSFRDSSSANQILIDNSSSTHPPNTARYAGIVYTCTYGALAMIGGLTADALVDNYRLLTACGVMHCGSLLLLSINACYDVHDQALFWIGLTLQALAAAIFEPTVFVFAAHQCRLRGRRQITAFSALYYWCMALCRIVPIIAGGHPPMKTLFWIATGLSTGSTIVFAALRRYYKRRLPNPTHILDACRWLFNTADGAAQMPEAVTNTLRRNILISTPFIGVLACCWTPIYLLRYALVQKTLPLGYLRIRTTDFCVLTVLFTPIVWALIRNGVALCPFRRTFWGIICLLSSSLVGAVGNLAHTANETQTSIVLAILPHQLLVAISEPLINVAVLEICWTFSTKELKTTLYGFITMSVAINGLMTAFVMWLLNLHHTFEGNDACYLYLGITVFQAFVVTFYGAYYRATMGVRTA